MFPFCGLLCTSFIFHCCDSQCHPPFHFSVHFDPTWYSCIFHLFHCYCGASLHVVIQSSSFISVVSITPSVLFMRGTSLSWSRSEFVSSSSISFRVSLSFSPSFTSSSPFLFLFLCVFYLCLHDQAQQFAQQKQKERSTIPTVARLERMTTRKPCSQRTPHVSLLVLPAHFAPGQAQRSLARFSLTASPFWSRAVSWWP